VTKHDFLSFLSEAYKFYGTWPDTQTLYKNLRLNTPKGQARWDRQLSSLMPRLLKTGLVCWLPCDGAAKGKSACGKPHLVLTDLGQIQLKTWDELGCDAHTHTANCHALEREFDFENHGKKVA